MTEEEKVANQMRKAAEGILKTWIEIEKPNLTQLGQKTPIPPSPEKAVLETFKRPKTVRFVKLETKEFTSLCPITGQPDWGEVEISYKPKAKCLESKSLKLFLHSFRSYEGFAEQMASYICERLSASLDPYRLEVTIKTNARGGISISATAEYMEDDE